MRNIGLSFAAAAVIAASVVGAAAQVPGERSGRYTISPADGGGFVRLDTETGQMSSCQRREGEWTCREMAEPGRGLDQEVERLRAENQRLKGELRQMEDILLGDKRDGSGRSTGRHAEAPRSGREGTGGMELRLPTEQDLDNAMTYMQRMLRKFREKMKEIEADSKGTPL
jgi:hypothetical protein